MRHLPAVLILAATLVACGRPDAPPGTAGWILNRDPAIPPDRLAAAREMLDFNGYDLTGLVVR